MHGWHAKVDFRSLKWKSQRKNLNKIRIFLILTIRDNWTLVLIKVIKKQNQMAQLTFLNNKKIK